MGIAYPIFLHGTMAGTVSVDGPKTDVEYDEETIHQRI